MSRLVQIAGNHVRLRNVVVHKANILSVNARSTIFKTPKIDVTIYEPHPSMAFNIKPVSFIYEERTKVITLSYRTEEERDADLQIIPQVWEE